MKEASPKADSPTVKDSDSGFILELFYGRLTQMEDYQRTYQASRIRLCRIFCLDKLIVRRLLLQMAHLGMIKIKRTGKIILEDEL